MAGIYSYKVRKGILSSYGMRFEIGIGKGTRFGRRILKENFKKTG